MSDVRVGQLYLQTLVEDLSHKVQRGEADFESGSIASSCESHSNPECETECTKSPRGPFLTLKRWKRRLPRSTNSSL